MTQPKIVTFSKMGNSILKIYVKAKIYFNCKYFELDASSSRTLSETPCSSGRNIYEYF